MCYLGHGNRDALNATKAAVAEGIVPGGGTALLYASQELNPEQLAGVDPNNMDQKTGAKIIKNALTVPIKAIANNAGVDGAVVVGKLLDIKDKEVGYNAATGKLAIRSYSSALLFSHSIIYLNSHNCIQECMRICTRLV